jgi:hypothetical protein
MMARIILLTAVGLALAASCGGAQGSRCTQTSDCAAGDAGPEECLFTIGDCSGVGQCLPPDQYGPRCNIIASPCIECAGEQVARICNQTFFLQPIRACP